MTSVDPRGSKRTVALVAATGAAVGCAASVCAAGGGLYALSDSADAGQVALLSLVAFLVVGGHVTTTTWAFYTRPEKREIAITQAPFAVTYALAIPWYLRDRFPILVFAWVAAGLSALAWLIVWHLRDTQRPRRLLAFVAAVVGLVAANTAGAFTIAWNASNGFGLRGESAPWTAFNNLAATSCIGDIDFRKTGGRVVPSDCPHGSGADYYAGRYDKRAFDNLLCEEQPRAAFRIWLDRQRDYGYNITLSFHGNWQVVVDDEALTPPWSEKQNGRTATLTIPMEVQATFYERDVKRRFTLDKNTELWRVELKTVGWGGWKVCRIDVADPIRVTDM